MLRSGVPPSCGQSPARTWAVNGDCEGSCAILIELTACQRAMNPAAANLCNVLPPQEALLWSCRFCISLPASIIGLTLSSEATSTGTACVWRHLLSYYSCCQVFQNSRTRRHNSACTLLELSWPSTRQYCLPRRKTANVRQSE